MLNTAAQRFQFFVFMGITQLHEKLTCSHAQYNEKKIWLKLRIHAKFCAKTLDIANYCAILFKTGFVLIQNDAKCCAKPRNCCAIESTVLWKPYQGTTEILLTINGHTGLLFHKLSMPPPLGGSSLAFDVKTDTSN